MLMQITLLKDHDTPQGYFKAGETIEVEEHIYDWLQEVYAADKLKDVKSLEEVTAKGMSK